MSLSGFLSLVAFLVSLLSFICFNFFFAVGFWSAAFVLLQSVSVIAEMVCVRFERSVRNVRDSGDSRS